MAHRYMEKMFVFEIFVQTLFVQKKQTNQVLVQFNLYLFCEKS